MDVLRRPLLLEGDAGVGKTEVAKALGRLHGSALVRLQCYEGLDINQAVYEWNYQGQLLAIKLMESSEAELAEREAKIFSERYLLKRPLLQAITEEDAVLLVDEVDRADEEFEAYLLEVLSDFQISIPEFGTVRAKKIPRVILTSNATREFSDALRRRCLYYYIDYPSFEKELEIVLLHLPDLERELAREAVRFVQALRREPLRKTPGIAETLDWVRALVGFNIERVSTSKDSLYDTLACLLKTKEDRADMTRERVLRLAHSVP